MALLQFKPAPMYILDEVDAALDLSHTQNIGRLIKTRFKGSQFIVVSLKDGMFNHANTIFVGLVVGIVSVMLTIGSEPSSWMEPVGCSVNTHDGSCCKNGLCVGNCSGLIWPGVVLGHDLHGLAMLHGLEFYEAAGNVVDW